MSLAKINLSNWPYPLWFAHRGGGTVAPENTLEGLQLAYDYGFRAVEFDVKLTKDKHSILLHDDDLARTAGVKALAQELNCIEISQVDVAIAYPQHQPAYVPTLAQIAAFCVQHDVAANIEIKPSPGMEIETAAIVAKEALALWQQAKFPAIFSSFSLAVLQRLQQEYPESLRGLLLEDWYATDAAVIAQLKALDCVSLHAAEKDLTAARVAAITAAGFAVLTWTVNDLQRADELIKWGVKGVITDLINLAPVPALS